MNLAYMMFKRSAKTGNVLSMIESQSEPERRVDGAIRKRVGMELDLRIIPGNRGKAGHNGCVRPLEKQ
jgi:hypothetical protein